MTLVREATIDLLRQLGMTTIFGNPGSTELPMFRDFPDDFRYVLGLQESVVLGMADGFAQGTRNAAFINLHSAAGVGHALGNLFTAWKNQTPLVVTAGQQARSILPYDPFLFAGRATEFPQPYVKWAIEPARAEDVPLAILRAYHIAMTPPMGPVFISVPVDDWDRECEMPEVTQVSAGLNADPEMLSLLGNKLAASKRPVFVVGAGIGRDDAWEEIIALAELHQAPVFVAPMAARCGFPEDHPLFAGFLGAFREQIVAALDGHDLILVLGAPGFTYHAESSGPHVPDGAELIQIGDDPQAASWLPSGVAMIANLKSTLAKLMEYAPADSRAIPAPKKPSAPLDGKGFAAPYVLQQIARQRPENSILLEEAPSHRGAMHDHLPIIRKDGFYTTASGGLGHGLPASIGMALARPDEPVIALLGDGSAMYAIQGLWSAAALDLNVTFIIMNNHRYQALHSFGQVFGMQELPGTDLGGLDFVGLAEAQGVNACRISDAAALEVALDKAFETSGPCLIEVIVD
jgi:benzoylformate decarboxylase